MATNIPLTGEFRVRNKDLFISFIQVNPKNTYKSEDRVYSKIGTEIIDTLKKLFSRKKLSTISGNNSQSFYEKNNFIENHLMVDGFEISLNTGLLGFTVSVILRILE